ncbi:zinc transporter ZIP13 isoform X2 [Leptonychotes weddellii]|uniref:Zinc transporter ZIP13 n=1 Tax=Leptonychotes weddellii TaxID=9713 RepID=A0A7F8QH07_LEPWE|nr:zinc transporter ZIP13 isoform X2 [Leptonychotes weddellii]
MPGCPCPGCGMAGQRLLFFTALVLELLGGAGGSQPALRSRGPAAACRLDNKESESWGALLSGERLDTWICSLLGSLMVGLSGVFPLLVIPLEMGTMLRSEAGARRLKQLLSFALGGLLGNVFLHLLPEAWAYTCSASPGGEGQSLQQQQQLGLWVIAGFLIFLALEKMLQDSKEKEGTSQAPSKDPAAAAALSGGHYLAQPAAEPGVSAVVQTIKVSGYLNLLANTIDNFTHGLAVAASFLVSKKIGLLTTMAILLHEIPHEVGDFAILLRAGFDRWSAAKLQLSTALGGLLGACFAICTQSPKGVGTGVVGGGGPRRGPSQRAQLPWPVSRPGSAPSVPCGSGCCTWLAWAPSRSGLLLPLQRRPWPGSCPSPLAASSTSPW